ncbi:hypothetical protein [Paracoccus marinus]|nr:hypothetical protein [Paracoccus marinus]
MAVLLQQGTWVIRKDGGRNRVGRGPHGWRDAGFAVSYHLIERGRIAVAPELRAPRGVYRARPRRNDGPPPLGDHLMNSIIYLVGLVVVVLFILSLLGLR